MLTAKVGQMSHYQPHLHISHQQLAAEMATRQNLSNQQFIENELAKIQQEKLRIQRQQETLTQKVCGCWSLSQ